MAVTSVLDTSAILWITDEVPNQNIPIERQQAVFDGITKLVEKALIAYPRQVVDELGVPDKKDYAYVWAKANYGKHPFGDPPDLLVKAVLAQVPAVLNTSPVRRTLNEADPYVLAQAVYVVDFEQDVQVVTEDSRARRGKMPMTQACLRLGLPCMSMAQFLDANGILP